MQRKENKLELFERDIECEHRRKPWRDTRVLFRLFFYIRGRHFTHSSPVSWPIYTTLDTSSNEIYELQINYALDVHCIINKLVIHRLLSHRLQCTFVHGAILLRVTNFVLTKTKFESAFRLFCKRFDPYIADISRHIFFVYLTIIIQNWKRMTFPNLILLLRFDLTVFSFYLQQENFYFFSSFL